MLRIITARNVNDAFYQFKEIATGSPDEWRHISPRGIPTMEYLGPVITEYARPDERVLFDQTRDANPFFHFFESLWILGGRRDVQFLHQFNPKMADYSDDGETFHAAYGHRLRKHFVREDGQYLEPVDQILEIVAMLKRDPDTRQAVMAIWDPAADLNVQSRDIPCNDMVFFKVREGALRMTVMCRSNDVIWGAYGTNVVQFSMLQELVARAGGFGIGNYRQYSDSFHVYVEQEAYLKSIGDMTEPRELYEIKEVQPFPLFTDSLEFGEWMYQLGQFLTFELNLERALTMPSLPFFDKVALPLLRSWKSFKGSSDEKNERIEIAQSILDQCAATDWQLACHRWLQRRKNT